MPRRQDIKVPIGLHHDSVHGMRKKESEIVIRREALSSRSPSPPSHITFGRHHSRENSSLCASLPVDKSCLSIVVGCVLRMSTTYTPPDLSTQPGYSEYGKNLGIGLGPFLLG